MSQTRYTTIEQIEEMQKEIQREKERRMNKRGLKFSWGKRKKAVFNWGTIFFFLTLMVLVSALFSIYSAKNRGEIPHIFGYQLFVVRSGSMEPTLNVGSVIIAKKPSEPDNLKVNDIVTFKSLSGEIITHRIIKIIDENGVRAYQTKGDNPINSPDQELLTPDRVIGVFIAKVPLTGIKE